MNFWGRAAIVFLLLALTRVELPARLWTTVTGQTFEAEFMRVEGANGIFQVREKEYPYPLNRLSVADRLFIGKTVNQQSAATAAPCASRTSDCRMGRTRSLPT